MRAVLGPADSVPQMPDPRLVRGCRTLVTAAGAAVGLTGVLILLGWACDVPTLKSVLPEVLGAPA